MVTTEMMEFVGKEGGQVIEKGDVSEFPAVVIFFCPGKRSSVSVESNLDKLEPLGKFGGRAPSSGKGPFASLGEEVIGRHPGSDVGCSTILASAAY